MAKTDVFQKKMFDGDIQEVMLMCAQKITNSASWFRFHDMDIDRGMIVCLVSAINVSWLSAVADYAYSIRLSFNKISTNNVECVASCWYMNGESAVNHFLSFPMRKMLLNKFMKIL